MMLQEDHRSIATLVRASKATRERNIKQHQRCYAQRNDQFHEYKLRHRSLTKVYTHS